MGIEFMGSRMGMVSWGGDGIHDPFLGRQQVQRKEPRASSLPSRGLGASDVPLALEDIVLCEAEGTSSSVLGWSDICLFLGGSFSLEACLPGGGG